MERFEREQAQAAQTWTTTTWAPDTDSRWPRKRRAEHSVLVVSRSLDGAPAPCRADGQRARSSWPNQPWSIIRSKADASSGALR